MQSRKNVIDDVFLDAGVISFNICNETFSNVKPENFNKHNNY